MGFLAHRSTAELYAFLNNGDGTMLSEEARRELAARGDLPEWAATPSNVDQNLEAAARPISNDPAVGASRKPQGRVPADPEDDRFDKRTGVVGPRTDDGRLPRMAPTFSGAEEAAEYYVRPRNPETGELMPSRADEAMMARGFVPVYTPDGNISYSMAADYDGPGGLADQMSPSARRTARMLETGIGADNRPIVNPLTGEAKQPVWQGVPVNTPFGPRQVLRLNEHGRQKEAQRRQQHLRDRVRGLTGLPPERLAEMSIADLQAEIRNHHIDRERSARDLLRERNIIAGGSHNVNSGNAAMFNTLARMPPEDRNTALQYMLPGGDLRASVEAQHNAQLTQLGLRVAQGQGFQQATPEQRELMQQKVDEGRPVQVRAQEHASAGRLNHPDVVQHANSIVDRLYSSVTFLGNTSEFTDNEVQLAAQRLADDLNISLEEALPIMQRIQEERRRNMLASGIVAGFYDH